MQIEDIMLYAERGLSPPPPHPQEWSISKNIRNHSGPNNLFHLSKKIKTER